MYPFRRLSFVALLATGALSCGFGTSPTSDTTPPVVVITSPAGTTVSGTVTFSAEVIDDTGVANVVFKVDDKTIAEDGLAPYQTTWASNTASDGTHRLSVTGFDVTGKTTTTSKSVTVSNNPE